MHEDKEEDEVEEPKSPSDNLLEPQLGPTIPLPTSREVKGKLEITTTLSQDLDQLAKEIKGFNEERRALPKPMTDLIKTTVDFSGQISQYNFIHSRTYSSLPSSVTSGMEASFNDLAGSNGNASELLAGCKSEIRSMKGFLLNRRSMGYS